MIEEEGLLEEDDMDRGLPRRCYFLAFVLGFVFLFSIFSLILWGASRPQKPLISMKVILVITSLSIDSLNGRKFFSEYQPNASTKFN